MCIHLGWGGLPNYKSLHHFEDQLPAQFKFLKRTIAGGLRTLLVAGTCLEYGMRSGRLSEELEPQPTTPYGFAKDSLRRQLRYLQGVEPFQLVWARLFYLYGPGQAPTSLYPQIAAAATRGDEAFNMSGGEQIRDYLPVETAARLPRLPCAARPRRWGSQCLFRRSDRSSNLVSVGLEITGGPSK